MESELRRLVKVLHLLGAIGYVGALAAHMILLATAPDDSLAGYALVRRNIEALSGWLLVPSLAVVTGSGLLSMVVHTAFQRAGWAWIKALLGLPIFEGTLVTIDATAQRAAELATRAAAGEAEPDLVARLVSGEWTALWILMTLGVAQTVLGVWRPRSRRRRIARAPEEDGRCVS